MTIQLLEVLNSCTNFAELLPIANQLKAKISFWGNRSVVLKSGLEGAPPNIIGEAPIGTLVERTQQIIKGRGFSRLTYPEYDVSLLLDAQIERLYEEDLVNFANCNIITKLFVIVREFYMSCFTPPFWSHQVHWKGDECCYAGFGRHILVQRNIADQI